MFDTIKLNASYPLILVAAAIAIFNTTPAGAQISGRCVMYCNNALPPPPPVWRAPSYQYDDDEEDEPSPPARAAPPRLAPTPAQKLNAQANKLFSAGNYEAATAKYRQAFKLSPSDKVIRANLARALSLAASSLQFKDLDAALAKIKEARNYADDDYARRVQGDIERQIAARQKLQMAEANAKRVIEQTTRQLSDSLQGGGNSAIPPVSLGGGLGIMSGTPGPGSGTAFFGQPANPTNPALNDSSVVDLRSRSTDTLDSRVVRGEQRVDAPQAIASSGAVPAGGGLGIMTGAMRDSPAPDPARREAALQLPSDDDMKLLFSNQRSAWLGPRNPDAPLINPLRDPERYRAMLKEERDKFPQHRALIDKLIDNTDQDVTAEIARRQTEAQEQLYQRFRQQVARALAPFYAQTGAHSPDELFAMARKDPKLGKLLQAKLDPLQESHESEQKKVSARALLELFQSFEPNMGSPEIK